MEENQLKALVESVVNYFNVTRNDDVSVGTPYLLNADQAEDAEFLSGMIAISGNKNGWLRYSAPRIMIKHLLLSMGESDTSIVNMEDMVGEVANTISGNLRKHFGSEFLISTPKVVSGSVNQQFSQGNERCYVVPLYWKQYNSSIVIYLS
ncbi:MAG: chemotaxis protein CheX [Pseudomonadales bacterium]|nr:chemotaxis protein CheX [Pseudomonadales bacterium]